MKKTRKKNRGAIFSFLLLLFICSGLGSLMAQSNLSTTGKIVDESGEPLIGVSIQVKGTGNGTITDINGQFTLSNVPLNSIIVISYLGSTTQEIKFTGQQNLSVTLKEDQKALEEVVVVGYATQKKVNLTAAVSSVGEKIFEDKPIISATDALQGTIPGLTIQQNSSEPGQTSNINIRGIGTFKSGTYPLVLIDGLAGSIDKLNPNDIESVSVLKDASATAIYGSRGANGIILITTKSGKSGKSRISYNFMYGSQEPTNLPRYAKAWEYAELRNEALLNSGMPAKYTAEDINRFRGMGDGTVWLDEIYRDSAPQSSQNVSVEGGSEKINYHVSLGYLDQRSLFEGNDDYGLKRYNARINVSAKVYDNLTVTAMGAFNRDDVNEHSWWTNWLIEQCTRMPVIYPIKDENGEFTLPSGSNSNALARLTEGGMRSYQNDNSLGSVSAEWEIFKNFKIKGFFGGNLTNNDMHEFHKSIDYAPYTGGADSQNSVHDKYDKTTLLNGTFTATYTKTFDKHVIGGLVGFSEENSKRRWFQVKGLDVPGNEFGVLSNTSRIDKSNTNGTGEEWDIQSYFGRLNYSYDNRYLLEASFREDGSSRFNSNRRWGFFPSVSAGWRISEEAFMESTKDYLSNLKLRASWGEVGNQDIGLYQYLRTITINPLAYSFNDNPASGANFSEVNQDVTWETSQMVDVGVDLGFFNNSLNVVFDFYNKNTSGILVNNLPVPGISGIPEGSYPTQNIGAMKNTGWELAVNYSLKTGQVNHTFGANVSDNVNEVTDDGGSESISGWDVQTILKKGYPINSYYAFKSDGFFQNEAEVAAGPRQTFNAAGAKPGDIRYVDRNHDGEIKEEDDRFILGNPFPRYSFGFNYGFTWKGFDLGFFLQGVGKRDTWIRGEAVEAFHNSNEGPVMDFHIDRWTPSNPDASYPRLTIGSESANNAAKSDFWIENAAYIRLKNAILGYTIPSHITQKIKMSKVRLYLTGTNLLTFTNLNAGYDPEAFNGDAQSGRVYPVSRVIAFGLDVNF